MKWTWRRKKRDEELNEEIRAHIEMAAREREERGETADEARAAARREFGNATLVKETTREMWGWASLERLWQDVRYGLRMMRRSPGFTIVAMLTLALGIGANTAMFSIFDAVVLRPLPVRDQGKLVVVKWTARTLPRKYGYSSYGDCAEDLQRSQSPGGCSLSLPMFNRIHTAGAGVFSGVGAYTSESSILLTGNGPARKVSAQVVSGEFFPMLGVRPALGRMLSPSDDLPNAAPAIALSYGYWQREFGGSSSVIGMTVHLNNVPFTIVGVAAQQFGDLTPGNEKELWLTFGQYPRLNISRHSKMNDDTESWVIVVGRLREGVSLAQAVSVVNAVFRNAMLNGPAPMLKPADDPSARLVPVQEGLNGIRYRILSPLHALIAAAGILLLIACANVAGLSLAGATTRRKEIAVRLALGAARSRIALQLLTENILVSLLGGACGIFIAYWGVRGITALSSGLEVSINAFPRVHLDLRVMAFAAAISVVTGALVGLVPISRSGDVGLTPALKEGANASANLRHGRPRRIKLSDVLVAAQIALAVVVLAAAGLLTRTFANLGRIDTGFDTSNMLLFSVDPTLAGYKSAQIQTLYGELQTRLAAIPGVVSTSYSAYSLLAGSWNSADIHIPGLQQNTTADIPMLPVGPGFFDTMRIPVLSGRAFGPADFAAAGDSCTTQAPLPAIINETFARKYFPAQNPLGLLVGGSSNVYSSHVGLTSASPKQISWQVVGIARDTKYDSLHRATPPMLYLPLCGGGVSFELRTAGNPEAILPEVRSIVAQMGENLPLLRITTMSEQIRKDISRERVMAQLSGVFGALSLLLAAIGIYGVISYIAVQRTHEIGIRMALGASPRNILASVLGHGGRVAAAGIALGLLGAAGVARLMTSMLYGVSGADPATFAGVAALLVFVALAACWIPARRATRVDPMVALRYE